MLGIPIARSVGQPISIDDLEAKTVKDELTLYDLKLAEFIAK